MQYIRETHRGDALACRVKHRHRRNDKLPCRCGIYRGGKRRMFDFSKWADAYIAGAFAGFDRQVVKKGVLRFFKRIAVESDPHKRLSRDIFVVIEDDLLKML